jgi:hypothetical protein
MFYFSVFCCSLCYVSVSLILRFRLFFLSCFVSLIFDICYPFLVVFVIYLSFHCSSCDCLSCSLCLLFSCGCFIGYLLLLRYAFCWLWYLFECFSYSFLFYFLAFCSFCNSLFDSFHLYDILLFFSLLFVFMMFSWIFVVCCALMFYYSSRDFLLYVFPIFDTVLFFLLFLFRIFVFVVFMLVFWHFIYLSCSSYYFFFIWLFFLVLVFLVIFVFCWFDFYRRFTATRTRAPRRRYHVWIVQQRAVWGQSRSGVYENRLPDTVKNATDLDGHAMFCSAYREKKDDIPHTSNN